MNIGVQKYGVFIPYKVQRVNDESRQNQKGRESYIFTDEAIDLIKSNPGEWFVIHETEIQPISNDGNLEANRSKIGSQRSTYYASAKYASAKLQGLEYTVNGVTDEATKTYTCKLIVIIND